MNEWFQLFDPWRTTKDLARVRAALAPSTIDMQDEWGMTALHLTVAHNWLEAAEMLIATGANTELRHYRTGETALYTAVQNRDEAAVRILVLGRANPDAMNYWGKSPREWATLFGLQHLFENIELAPTVPQPRIQNAEHLADHSERFRIPPRAEREALRPGQAVDIHVFGPLPPAVKVRIRERRGTDNVSYVGVLDPPEQKTNLESGTSEVTFGPEHVATVYVPRR